MNIALSNNSIPASNSGDTRLHATGAAGSIAGVIATGAFAAALLATGPVQAAEPAAPVVATTWVKSWSASPQPVWGEGFALPTNIPASLQDQTLRQVAAVSLGGRRVRVVLSNEYGVTPLQIGAARIALSAPSALPGQGAGIVKATDKVLTFGGLASVSIPPGAPVISDAVELDVPALASLAVSIYLPQATPLSTFHWDARQTAYIVPGNQVAAGDIRAGDTVQARVFLSDILVEAGADARTVVALGDSITDGNGATMDQNRRWPDFLARRMAADNVAVLNAGISGAQLLKDGMGVNALARFERDVLSQPQLTSVIVLLGINDISWPGTAFAQQASAPSLQQMIAGYRQLISRARARQVRIIAATLTPFEGALQDSPISGYYNRDKDRLRQAVNQWMRSSGEFDAVIDFDAVLRDPQHAARFLPAYDSGDHLHPGDAGNQAMADAIDLALLFGAAPARVAQAADVADVAAAAR